MRATFVCAFFTLLGFNVLGYGQELYRFARATSGGNSSPFPRYSGDVAQRFGEQAFGGLRDVIPKQDDVSASLDTADFVRDFSNLDAVQFGLRNFAPDYVQIEKFRFGEAINDAGRRVGFTPAPPGDSTGTGAGSATQTNVRSSYQNSFQIPRDVGSLQNRRGYELLKNDRRLRFQRLDAQFVASLIKFRPNRSLALPVHFN